MTVHPSDISGAKAGERLTGSVAGDQTWLGKHVGLAINRVQAIALAVWCGVIAGLIEASILEIGARVLHIPAGQLIPPEVFWYAPLAATVTMVALVLLLVVLDAVLPRVGFLQLALPACVGLATFSVIRSLRQGVANIPAAVLALGIAVVVVRLLAKRPQVLQRNVSRTAPWLAGLMALYAVAVPVTRGLSERRALGTLPAPAGQAPNVLVVVLDAVRQHNLSLYGYQRLTTPNLDAFARKGAVFERAFATTPWSLPSHAAILTGLYPNDMTAAHRHALDETPLLLSEFLARQGYATGGFVGNMSFLQPDFGLARGFTTYDSRPPKDLPTIASTWWLSGTLYKTIRAWSGVYQSIPRRPSEHVNRALMSWIDRRGDRPFFAFVNYFDAHAPYLPPAPFDTSFGRTGRYWTAQTPRRYSAVELQQMQTAYDGGIKYMDEQLHQLLTHLEQRGDLDHTIVIITADHGEEFGEHDPSVVEHSLTLHATSTMIPFVLVYPPSVPAGMRIRQPVSLRDIPATVVDLAKLTGSPFPGAPIARYASADTSLRPPATPRGMSVEKWFRGSLPDWTANNGDLFGVVDGDRHYFVDAKGGEHLFDLTADPLEQTNLAPQPQTAAERVRLRAVIDSLLSGPDGKLRANAPPKGGRALGTGKKLRRR